MSRLNSPHLWSYHRFILLELMLYQSSCHRDGFPLLFTFFGGIHSLLFSQGKKTRIRCGKKKCVQLLSMLNLHQSPTLSQLSRWGLKNETAIIVITGLRNNIVGKRRGEEKFWQLFLWEDLIKKNPTATGDRRRDSSKLKQPFLKCSFLHHSNCCSFTQI